MVVNCKEHYDLLISENNDPIYDPEPLKEYMDKWDGELFLCKLQLTGCENVLEIGLVPGGSHCAQQGSASGLPEWIYRKKR